MALRNPPSWLQQGSHPAENDRLTTQGTYRTSGILDTNDLLVSASSPAAMTVQVAAGWGVIVGDYQSNMGAYQFYNDAATTLTVTANTSGNPRIDRVVVTVSDAAYIGLLNQVAFQVIAGTPAGSPVAPATPTNSISLATIAVANGTSSITAGNITDTRTLATSNAAVVAPAVLKSTIDAKGDLLVGTADNTVARLGVGANGLVLKADSTQATGLIWGTAGVDGGAYLPALWPIIPPTVSLRATITSTTSGLSYPVNQVFIIAVGGGGSGASGNTGYNNGAGGGGACLIGWVPTITAVTIGGSNGNTTLTHAGGTITAYAGGAGGAGSATAFGNPGANGRFGSAGGGGGVGATVVAGGGAGSVMGLSTGGSGGAARGSGYTFAQTAGSGGGAGAGGSAAGGNGLFGPGGGGANTSGGTAFNLATGTTYSGGTPSNNNGGGGAGILANGANAISGAAGAGGNGGGGGGAGNNAGDAAGAGGSGVVYIYY